MLPRVPPVEDDVSSWERKRFALDVGVEALEVVEELLVGTDVVFVEFGDGAKADAARNDGEGEVEAKSEFDDGESSRVRMETDNGFG